MGRGNSYSDDIAAQPTKYMFSIWHNVSIFQVPSQNIFIRICTVFREALFECQIIDQVIFR